MRLWDTYRGELAEFLPGTTVRIYTCGITPYDSAHLGHAATFLAYDLLQRRLRDMGCRTLLVRNVTDLDDDILRRSKELGVHYLDLAAEEIARFDSDMAALGLIEPWRAPRATSFISNIMNCVEALIKSGVAYEAGGSVYFSVGSTPSFGSLSRLDRGEMLRLAAERGGNPEDPNKRDPLDFVLWQAAGDDEPAWDSRWGRGRPGWHIECTAMVLDTLGPSIDVHGGGEDLIFPHHECERVQSETITGCQFVRHWMHAGMVRLDGEKMSKSLGNLVFVHDLLKDWDAPVVRLAVISHHYRSSWEFDWASLPEAAERLEAWRSAGEGDGALEEVRECLDDDLDTPGAIAAIDEAVRRGEGVSSAVALLGCL
jgi:L-cysteine:1D-myo-inositol 2-amino-2-deoxy-alpha-D-glucopyranoside ligase